MIIRKGNSKVALREFNDLGKQFTSEHKGYSSSEVVPHHLLELLVSKTSSGVSGKLALYNNPYITYENKKVLLAGGFDSINAIEIANQLLSEAALIAKEMGADWVIGPMEGSTWNSYRFAEHNAQPAFLLEPNQPPYYATLWEENEFVPIADYVSFLDRSLAFSQPEINRLKEDMHSKGGHLKNISKSELQNYLPRLHRFCMSCFENNFLFSPISEENFIALNQGLLSIMDKEFTWVIEDESGKIHAFFFGYPDLMDETGDTLIVKTIGRLKDSPFRKTAILIGHLCNQKAQQRGFRKCIHALVIRNNASVKVSQTFNGEIYKNYQLYGRRI